MSGTQHEETPELSNIEYTILRLAAQGMNQQQIADQTQYSVNTIKQYRSRAVRKLGATNLAAAVAWMSARDLLDTDQQAA